MVLHLSVPDERELRPRITVFGVGGAGGNAVNNMISKNLEGADFVVANTDAQALANSKATRRIQLGASTTEGLGAGMRPEVGREAAEESIGEITDMLAGSHMCFITAGMGGGTGTGAAPVIARAARELNVLTVGVVSKPFQFEGRRRMNLAEQGITELQDYVDTLIIIPNQNLFRIANERTTVLEAFNLADDVLYQGVKGVTDLMVMPGLINLDFADVRTVMNEMGKAMMGTGEAEGETRAIDAAEKAIANPLLDDISLHGARGVLINITGGYDLTLFEVDEAANRIRQEVDAEANIIIGSCFDESLEGGMRVSVVATGIEAEAVAQQSSGQALVEDTLLQPKPHRHSETGQPGQTVSTSMRNEVRATTTGPGTPVARPAGRPAARPETARHAAQGVPAASLTDDFDIDAASVEPTVQEQGSYFIPPAPAEAQGAPSGQPTGIIVDPLADSPADYHDVEIDKSAPHEPQEEAPLYRGGLDVLRRLSRERIAADGSAQRGAVNPQIKAPSIDDENGILEIPTFLRRQAN